MEKPKSQIMIEKIRNHERVECPKCRKGREFCFPCWKKILGQGGVK